MSTLLKLDHTSRMMWHNGIFYVRVEMLVRCFHSHENTRASKTSTVETFAGVVETHSDVTSIFKVG